MAGREAGQGELTGHSDETQAGHECLTCGALYGPGENAQGCLDQGHELEEFEAECWLPVASVE